MFFSEVRQNYTWDLRRSLTPTTALGLSFRSERLPTGASRRHIGGGHLLRLLRSLFDELGRSDPLHRRRPLLDRPGREEETLRLRHGQLLSSELKRRKYVYYYSK